jgi:dihydrofolate reductase
MSGYWKAAEHDENEKDVMRTLARTFNNKRKIVYSHEDMTVDWQNTEVHVVTDDQALAKDIQRLKQEVDGTIIVYGGVRLARSLVRQDLVDEFNFDVCPVILGEGQPLFSQLTHRTKLRVRHVATYDSGTTSISYEVVR